jgi:hypothetical protein
MSRSAPALLFPVLVTGCLASGLLVTGCYVRVDKSPHGGDDKDVEVHSPLGGLHVRTELPNADDVGLPSYPNATPLAGKDGHEGADVHLGFGDWQLRVTVAKYQSTDPRTRVESFYRTALARYGQVIECRGDHAMGAPSITRDGLSCEDKEPSSKSVHVGDDELDYNLRAGSKRHQHIVGFSDGGNNGTRFSLIRLDLPGASEQSDKAE